MKYYEGLRETLETEYIRQDREGITKGLSEVINNMLEEKTETAECLSIASEIMYFTIYHINHGRNILTKIFHMYTNGYQCLFGFHSHMQIATWLVMLRDGLYEQLQENEQDAKQKMVSTVQAYIRKHVRERISLSETAEMFHLSPSYLSTLFARYSEYGFNDYVNRMKIDASKDLLVERNMKIYEIAEYLGFKNAFYFNRVFKKMEGISPSEYALREIMASA